MAALGALCGGCTALIDSSQYVGAGSGDGGTRDGGDAMVDPDGPSTPAIELGPASPRTTDDLVVTITTESVDPLSGTVSYEYRWFRNDTLVEDQTGATLDAALTTKSQTWRVEVTPIATPGDRRGAAASAQVTIENTPPVLTTVAFDRYILAVGEPIRATTGPVVDPDGDPISQRLEWRRNGEVIPGATATTLATTAFAPGDHVEIDAWATDGQAESGHVRVSVTLDPPTTRWRPISPRSFETFETTAFYDEQHRRWVHYDGTFLWERWVASGRVRTAAIPVSGVGPSSQAFFAVHDVEGRRLLFRSLDNPALLYVLDLTHRGSEAWTSMTAAGVAPDLRFAPATYYDRSTRTLWGFGGFNERLTDTLGADVWSLSLTPGSETWTQYTVAGTPLPGGFGAALAADPSQEGVLYLLGGASAGGGGLEMSTTIRRLTITDLTATVEELPVALPRPSFGPAVATTDDAIIIAGGADDLDDASGPFGAVRFDPSAGTITDLAGAPPHGWFGLLVHDPDDASRLLHWRGITDGQVARDGSGTGFELRAFDIAAGTVTDVAIEQRPPGFSDGGLSSRGEDPEVVMIGGRLESRVANAVAWVYRKGSDDWTTRTIPEDAVITMSPEPRWGVRFFDVSRWSGLQFFGGATDEGTLADNEVWEVVDGRWLRHTLSAGEVAPESRLGAAFIATGACGYQRNYMFGGQRLDGTLLADARSLQCPHDQPRACYWGDAASGGAAPSARSYATMGLDRNSYGWVFGGRTASGATASVHSFFVCSGDPPPWTAATAAGTPPAARFAHSMSLVPPEAAGDLDSFVIFGGTTNDEDETAALGDAWRLEITSSSTVRWTPITPTTALHPTPRAYHQAFWDSARSRLVVFGGRTASYGTLSDVWELIVVP